MRAAHGAPMHRSVALLLVEAAAMAIGSAACSSSSRNCEGPPPPDRSTDMEISSAAACAIASQALAVGELAPTIGLAPDGSLALASPAQTLFTSACETTCDPFPGPSDYNECSLPADYVQAFVLAWAARTEGVSGDAVPDASQAQGDAGVVVCPDAGNVAFTCIYSNMGWCTGRMTAGIDDPRGPGELTTGEYFAVSSYLEAASVHAFDRLAAELTEHGAPSDLVAAARRARDDERRHARAMRALARRFGVQATWPHVSPVRSRDLFELALENAREGCVAESYGAALALVSAARAADPRVREVMRSIARDECQHAELSWRVLSWTSSRLAASDRAAVLRHLRASAEDLSARAGLRPTRECAKICGLAIADERRRLAAALTESLFRGADWLVS
jgi:hypothetical protein